jgi:cob(I)alamin adenosyltransferase
LKFLVRLADIVPVGGNPQRRCGFIIEHERAGQLLQFLDDMARVLIEQHELPGERIQIARVAVARFVARWRENGGRLVARIAGPAEHI